MSAMTKADEVRHCWGVVAGEYSDYSVLCICKSEKAAEAVAAKLRSDPGNWHPDARTQAIPIADASIEKAALLYLTTTLWDDGTETNTRDDVRHEWPFDVDFVDCAWRWVRAPVYKNAGGRLDVHGFDHERVRKVFSDRRAQIRADDALRLETEAKGRVAVTDGAAS